MREFQERRKTRNIIFSWPIIGFLVVFNIVVGVRLVGIYTESLSASKEEETANHELQALENKKIKLETEVKRLSADQGIEEELRKRFGMAKPGEEMLIIINNNAKGSSSGQIVKSSGGFWQNFLAFIKSLL